MEAKFSFFIYSCYYYDDYYFPLISRRALMLFISMAAERKYLTANVRVSDGAWCVRQRSMSRLAGEMYTSTRCCMKPHTLLMLIQHRDDDDDGGKWKKQKKKQRFIPQKNISPSSTCVCWILFFWFCARSNTKRLRLISRYFHISHLFWYFSFNLGEDLSVHAILELVDSHLDPPFGRRWKCYTTKF